MTISLEILNKEVEKIKERNQRVERDKAWETSYFRKFLIFILTYIVIVIFFFFAGLAQPFINAIVPSLAFLLSTISIPLVKNWWIKRAK